MSIIDQNPEGFMIVDEQPLRIVTSWADLYMKVAVLVYSSTETSYYDRRMSEVVDDLMLNQNPKYLHSKAIALLLQKGYNIEDIRIYTPMNRQVL